MLSMKQGTQVKTNEPDMNSTPKQLADAIKDVYHPSGMMIMNVFVEQESKDYGACRLELDNRKVVFRVAKTTPVKVGQFVTVWQRPHLGDSYVPFNSKDGVEFLVVSVSDTTHRGQFVFDKDILIQQGVMGNGGARGKGAFRVYAPWINPDNRSALKAKEWQCRYFFSQDSLDLEKVRKLFKVLPDRRDGLGRPCRLASL